MRAQLTRQSCNLVVVGICLTTVAPIAGENSAKSPHTPTADELLLFRPTRFPEGNWQPDALNFRDVWFTASDGVELHGWYLPHENPVAVVLHLHGSGGNLSDRRTLMQYLQTEHQLALLIFDYRGYGRSEGVPTVNGCLLDAAEARKELAALAGVRREDIVLMGHSLGGALAIQLATEQAPRALIVESSFSSLKEMADLHFPNFSWMVPADKLNSLTAIKKYHGPYLQCHGESDTLIPFSSGQKLFRAANHPKRFVRMPKVGHDDLPSRSYYVALDRFLRTLPKRN